MKRTTVRTSTLLAIGLFVAVGIGWYAEIAQAATSLPSSFSWQNVSGSNGKFYSGQPYSDPNTVIESSYGSGGMMAMYGMQNQITSGDPTQVWSTGAGQMGNGVGGLSPQTLLEWDYQNTSYTFTNNNSTYTWFGYGGAHTGSYNANSPTTCGVLTYPDLWDRANSVNNWANYSMPYELNYVGCKMNGTVSQSAGTLSGTATWGLTTATPYTGTTSVPTYGYGYDRRLLASAATNVIYGSSSTSITDIKNALLSGTVMGSYGQGDLWGDGWTPDNKNPSYSGHDIMLVGYKDDPTVPGGGYFIASDSLEIPYYEYASNGKQKTVSTNFTGTAAFNGALNAETWQAAGNGTWDLVNTSTNWSHNTSSGPWNFSTSSGTVTIGNNAYLNGETAVAFPAGRTSTITIVTSGSAIKTYGIATGTSSNYTFSGGPIVITGNFDHNQSNGSGTTNLYQGGINVAGGTNSNGGTGTVAFTNTLITVGPPSTWTVPTSSSLTIGSSTPVNLNINTLTLAGNGTTTFNNKIADITDSTDTATGVLNTYEHNNNVQLEPGMSGNLIVGGGATTPGSPMVILNGANTYCGTTTLNSGTLTLNNANPINNSTLLWNGGTLSLSGGAQQTLNLAGLGGSTTGALALAGVNPALNITGGTNSVGNGTISTASNPFAGALSGSFAMNVTGGTLGLSGNNSGYTGTVTVTGAGGAATPGSIVLSSSSNLGTGPLTISNGGLVSLTAANNNLNNSSLTINNGQVSLGASINLAATSLTLNSGGSVLNTATGVTGTVSGAISGVGALTTTGTGTLTLGTNNTYAGATNLNGGTVLVSSASNFPSGTALNLNGATLAWTTGNFFDPTTVGPVTFGIGTSSGLKLNVNGTIAGAIGGSGSVIVTTGGTTTSLTLSGANTYSGTTVVGGALAAQLILTNPNALQNSTLTLSNNSDVVNLGTSVRFKRRQVVRAE